MDSRGIINLRTWVKGSPHPVHWDSFSDRPELAQGRGAAIPQEGTGLRGKDGREIFRGDIVSMGGAIYLVGYKKGGYCLQVLEDGGGGAKDTWLHDTDPSEIEIAGNSLLNSEFVVQCINRNLGRGGKAS